MGIINQNTEVYNYRQLTIISFLVLIFMISYFYKFFDYCMFVKSIKTKKYQIFSKKKQLIIIHENIGIQK